MNKSTAAMVRKETSKRAQALRKRLEESRTMHVGIGLTAATLTGAALGEAERRGVPMVIGGSVPVRPAVAIAAAAGVLMTKGTVSAALLGSAFAAAGVYGYEASQKRTFVAGSFGHSARSYTQV
jgi:hypothetical protein